MDVKKAAGTIVSYIVLGIIALFIVAALIFFLNPAWNF